MINVNMKKSISLIVLGCLMIFGSYSQTLKTKQKVVTIVSQRSIALNGGARASLGGKSRVIIPVTLPPNTKSWHYSFSTSPGESGAMLLNLTAQLSSLLVDPSGLSAKVLENLEVPSGSAAIDVNVLDKDNVKPFEEKADLNGGSYKLYTDLSVSNHKQAVITINSLTEGTYYLGLRNPSTFDGVNVIIEVVAITEEYVTRTAKEEQAVSNGDLGWKAFERGDYDRCLNLSKKALKQDPTLGYVYFNLALTYLIKGKSDLATSEYTKAISVAKKSIIPKQTLEGAINDLKQYISKISDQGVAKDILYLLEMEFKKYQ